MPFQQQGSKAATLICLSFLRNSSAVEIDMMAQRYGKTPAEILDERKDLSVLERYTLNYAVFGAGIEWEIEQQKRQLKAQNKR